MNSFNRTDIDNLSDFSWEKEGKTYFSFSTMING